MMDGNKADTEKAMCHSPSGRDNLNADFVLVSSFNGMNFTPELLRGIQEHKHFERPSPIQQGAIIPILQGHPTIISAPSGSGKTTACCLSILQKLDMSMATTQCLILVPYRELAFEVENVILSLGKHLIGLSCYACHVGGGRAREDIARLADHPHVVICTPGRMVFIVNRKALEMDQVNVLCIDEIDDMVSRKFQELLLRVIETLPFGVQIVANAPTMPDDVLNLITKIMHEPLWISDKSGQGGTRVVHHVKMSENSTVTMGTYDAIE